MEKIASPQGEIIEEVRKDDLFPLTSNQTSDNLHR
jgi:hypothetical protein